MELRTTPRSRPPELITQNNSRRGSSSALTPLNPVDRDWEYRPSNFQIVDNSPGTVQCGGIVQTSTHGPFSLLRLHAAVTVLLGYRLSVAFSLLMMDRKSTRLNSSHSSISY